MRFLNIVMSLPMSPPLTITNMNVNVREEDILREREKEEQGEEDGKVRRGRAKREGNKRVGLLRLTYEMPSSVV